MYNQLKHFFTARQRGLIHDMDEGPGNLNASATGEVAGGGPFSAWGLGEAAVALGCVLCIMAAAALPWARTRVTWKSVLLGYDIELGIFTFRLTDNPWLSAVIICVAVLCLAGLLWRRQAGNITIACAFLLFAGSAVYVICLIEDAFDFLGIYEQLLVLIRGLPAIGPMAESAIRERLNMSAVPHAGVYIFIGATLLILTGGILMRRRTRARAAHV